MKHLPEPGTITMFSTTWCGYCTRLKKQLERHGVVFSDVNIEETPGTAEIVASLNDGNHTVPTVVYPDGSAATNPSVADILANLGLTMPTAPTEAA